MQESAALVCYGFDYAGVVVADVHAGDARVEVDVLVSINVFTMQSFAVSSQAGNNANRQGKQTVHLSEQLSGLGQEG